MIKDKLEHLDTYLNLSTGIKLGLEWLKNTDLINIEEGKQIIDGDRVWANVQEYDTKSDAKFEAHRKYIDIQCVIKGKELVGITSLSNCITCTRYDNEKDIEFFDCSADAEYQELSEGEFLIIYPHEVHKPSITSDKTTTVKKVVVKVSI